MEKENIYKKHILDAVDTVEEYVKGLSFSEFEKNKLVRDGVIRELEVIGEAAKRLSVEFKALVPAIPWRQVTGTRDKLIHDYMSVDLEEVWQIVKSDLPSLKQKLIAR